jgi:hypothetical protein
MYTVQGIIIIEIIMKNNKLNQYIIIIYANITTAIINEFKSVIIKYTLQKNK